MQLKELLAEKHQEGLLFNKIVVIYVSCHFLTFFVTVSSLLLFWDGNILTPQTTENLCKQV